MTKLNYKPQADHDDVRDYLDNIAHKIMEGNFHTSFLGVVKTVQPLTKEQEEQYSDMIIEKSTPTNAQQLRDAALGYAVVKYPIPITTDEPVRIWLAEYLEWCQLHNRDPETLAYIAALIHPQGDGAERWHIKMFTPEKIDTKVLERIGDTEFFSSTEWNDGHIDPVFKTYFRNPFTASREDIEWTRGE